MLRSARGATALRSVLAAEEFFGGSGIFRGIDPGAGGFCDEDTDFGPVFEGAELFQLFGFFEWGRFSFDEIQQEPSPVSVYAEMPESGGRCAVPVAVAWDRASGKIEGVPPEITDDFDGVGVVQIGGIERAGGCGHPDAGLVVQRPDQPSREFGIEKWFVALDVEDDAR